MTRFRAILAAALLGLVPMSALGHDVGLSSLELEWTARGVAAHLSFARSDLDHRIRVEGNRTGSPGTSGLVATQSALQTLAPEFLEIRIDGRNVPGFVVSIDPDSADGLRVRLEFPAAPGRSLRVRSKILADLPPGHRQYTSVTDEVGRRQAGRTLDRVHDGVLANRLTTTSPSMTSFRQFAFLGVEHIVTGYDHVLFLLGVLLLSGSLSMAAKIVTSFTAAHSLTLALATLDIISIRPTVVEPLIALSIVYVGVENLVRKNIGRRWPLTFAFGLVHGLGFASQLGDLRGAGDAIVPLLSFNLGVEVGQLAIAAVTLPLLWRLRTHPSVPSPSRWVPACSVLIALAGSYWFLERTLLA